MKKSMRSSTPKSSPRPASRPASVSRPKESFSRPKESPRPGPIGGQSKEGSHFGTGFGDKENHPGGQPFMQQPHGWRRRRTPLIVTLVLLVLCCLLVLCIAAAVYLVNQGMITFPTS
jgi:hypothetical protein